RICEKANNTSPQIPERLKEYKEAMRDRLIIGSVPKYENQSKGLSYDIRRIEIPSELDV
ncbi:hypothetical protein EZS27_028147, partial [termite gut metagenome]